MTDFVYAWFWDEEEERWLLAVSEKSYFEEEGVMNDSYEDEVLDELEAVMADIDCYEITESMYESESLSKEEIDEHLKELGNFHKDPEFARFIGA